MRMRLGILHDTAAQERMHAREAASAEAKKKQAEIPTVRTEADQKTHDAQGSEARETKDASKKEKPAIKIRPLSEARAIELGANFASEAFIFAVAAGLLVFERWWSKRKENKRDEHVVERIEALEERSNMVAGLEEEISRLRAHAVEREPLPTAGLRKDSKTDVAAPVRVAAKAG